MKSNKPLCSNGPAQETCARRKKMRVAFMIVSCIFTTFWRSLKITWDSGFPPLYLFTPPSRVLLLVVSSVIWSTISWPLLMNLSHVIMCLLCWLCPNISGCSPSGRALWFLVLHPCLAQYFEHKWLSYCQFINNIMHSVCSKEPNKCDVLKPKLYIHSKFLIISIWIK